MYLTLKYCIDIFIIFLLYYIIVKDIMIDNIV